MRSSKKLIRYIINSIIIILIVLLGLLGIRYYENKIDLANSKKIEEEALILSYYEHNGQYYKQNNDIELILCVGLDSEEYSIYDSYRNNELADCIVLLAYNKTNNTVLPIQINRDTMCDYHVLGIGGKITNDTFGQIALSHSYGSGDMQSLVNVKDAVSNLMCNIKIDYYISLTMNAVAKVNDKAGGVKVYVEDDFSSIDSTLTQNKEVTLYGDHALTFVRARQGLDDSSNINRLKRQRVYLRSLYDTCKQKVETDNSFISNCLESVSEYLIANTNIYGLSDIGNDILNAELLESVQLEGKASINNEYAEFYVDEDVLEEFCINTFYKSVN